MVSSQCLWLYAFHCDVLHMRQRTPMRTEHMFVIWSCIRTGLSTSCPSPYLHSIFTDSFKAVPLLQFFFVVYRWFHNYVAFVLSLFAPHLSLFWCLSRAVLCDIISGYLHLYFFISIKRGFGTKQGLPCAYSQSDHDLNMSCNSQCLCGPLKSL